LPRLHHTMFRVEGIKMAINYGLNKVRFPAPVRVGAEVRAHGSLVAVTDLGDGGYQLTLSTSVEVAGSEKPACVAESILRYMT
ncbi:MAG TPA: dehydratase, partial [Mycobacterium sp.]|nr:dehydratase [Mycobacterium sp.]